MAKSKDSAPKGSKGKSTKFPPKAGPKRPSSMTSYRDTKGKRHWEAASSKKK